MKFTDDYLRENFIRLNEVKLGEDVKIYSFVNAYGCEIGDESRVGAFVEIQKGVSIGKRCKISSHSFLCEGVTIEDNVFIGHGVMFTNDKFPRATNPDGSPQSEADWSRPDHRQKRCQHRLKRNHPRRRHHRQKRNGRGGCGRHKRRSFTAPTYDDWTLWDLDYKILLVIAQVIGYAISKFIGIRFISGLDGSKRNLYFIGLISFSFAALLGFMWAPYPYGLVWLFLNGLPLGLIRGIVFQYLEGRRITEILTVILSANFILSSGVAKSIGQYLIQAGITETSMPVVIGLIFFPIMLISVDVVVYSRADGEEIRLRAPRQAMDAHQRKNSSKITDPFWYFLSSFILRSL